MADDRLPGLCVLRVHQENSTPKAEFMRKVIVELCEDSRRLQLLFK